MVQSYPNYWYRTLGETGDDICFRVRIGAESSPVDGVSYLRARLGKAAAAAAKRDLLEAAEHFYVVIPVELSFDSVPPVGKGARIDEAKDLAEAVHKHQLGETEEEEIMLDYWSPSQLALALEQVESVCEFLEFHARNAAAVLTELVSRTTTAVEAGPRLVFAHLATLPGAVLLLGDLPHEPDLASLSAAEETFLRADETALRPATVLKALHPLLEELLRGREKGVVWEALMRFLSTLPPQGVRESTGARHDLLVDAAAVSELCETVPALERFDNLLKRLLDHSVALRPVLRGRAVLQKGLPREPIWIACAAQEPDRLVLYARWLACLSGEDAFPAPEGTSERAKQTKKALFRPDSEATEAIRSCWAKACAEVRGTGALFTTPRCVVWHAQLSFLRYSLSSQWPLAWFENLVKDLHAEGGDFRELFAVTGSTGLPGVVVLTLAVGAAARACVRDGAQLHDLLQRLACVIGRPASLAATTMSDSAGGALRWFLTTPPATHAARFEELWLAAAVPLRGPVKFPSRPAMVYAAVVDDVLCSAEVAAEATPQAPFPAAALEALGAYVAFWVEVYQALASAQESATKEKAREDSTDQASVCHENALDQEDEGHGDIVETPAVLLAALRRRLATGRRPLPSLHEALFSDKTTSAGKSSGSLSLASAPATARDGVLSSQADVAQEEEAEQEGFVEAQRRFTAAAAGLDVATQLHFYALYKQASVGDVTGSKPWSIDAVKRAKWEAWDRLRGMSAKDARARYVMAARERWGVDGEGKTSRPC